MKKVLIFIIIFLAAAIMGLVRYYLLGVDVSGPEDVILHSPRTVKPQIQYSGGENPLLALLGKNKVENSLDGVTTNGEKKAGPPSQFEKYKSILLLAGMTNKDIPHYSKEELEDFLGKLEEVSNRRDTNNGNGQAQEIFFSTLQPDLKIGLSEGNQYFPQNSPRLYAVFSSNTDSFQDLENVLVKWFNPLGNVDMFQYMKIAPNSNYNYIWREFDNWEPGIYNVELYGIGKDIKILASGSYFVQDLKE